MDKRKRKIILIVGVILLILAVCAILPKWNEIWYEFGEVIYRITH